MEYDPERLQRTLSLIPDAPGVYMMLAADGSVLYIGKAVSLRSRVRSYFQDASALGPRLAAMVERVADVRTLVVDNEIEALILEANLIKKHQPPFNVRLRDDKRYPYLKITAEPFPRVVFTRTIANDGARYFGPYTNARALRELIDVVRIIFPLRTCREPIDGRRARPCLQYHIRRCMAPCVGYQSREEYDRVVEDVALFLEGRREPLLERLQAEMHAEAEALRFEAAARIRDRIVAVRRVTESQKVVWTTRVDMDLIAAARRQGQACVQVFLVRGGVLIGQEHFILDGTAERSDADLFAAFLQQLYAARTPEPEAILSPLATRAARANDVPSAAPVRSRRTAGTIPKEILVEAEPADRPLLERWLSKLKGQRVRILTPRRGRRLEYLELVRDNARRNLEAFLVHQEVQETAQARALSELAEALELPDIPRRIECFDVSNVQGRQPVASMVVFVEGRAKKSEYRRFALRYDRGPNDFAMMQEALRRRLRYVKNDTDHAANGEHDLVRELAKRERFSRRPDLLLIDGGKGQLNAVMEVIDELDLSGIPVAALAKEHEWLYLPERTEPVVLPAGSAALHLVMRIRDEAHRFAVGFHRARRAKAMTRSALDEIPGLGTVRKRRLLAAFGSPGAIARADLDEIAAVKGMTPALAARVKATLTGVS